MEKTRVRFVDGFDGHVPQPDYARQAGLGCRFAIIQDTYRPDIGEMYFDEPLWLAMVAFARTAGTEVHIGLEQKIGKEETLDGFLAEWSQLAYDDKCPPPFILVREAGRMTMVIETEHWAHVGGPGIYHDSYTYAVHSAEPVGPAVMNYLVGANTGLWDLATEAVIGVVHTKTFWQRVWAWVSRWLLI